VCTSRCFDKAGLLESAVPIAGPMGPKEPEGTRILNACQGLDSSTD
jgi:hypothetical protein